MCVLTPIEWRNNACIRTIVQETIDTKVYRKAAEEHFKDSAKIRALSKKYNVCHGTLYRFITKLKSGNTNSVVSYRRINRVFTVDEESYLRDYLIECSRVYFGLSPSEVRKLSYQLAIKSGKTFPDRWHNSQMAGKEWFKGSLKRHPSVSLRSPQATARASSFNEDCEQFFW